jgi:predicted type IV restriction endonuclease
MPADRGLLPVLEDVRRRIARAKADGLNEQNTKATLIEPVLKALGWDIEDVEEVVREYGHKKRDKPVDYALLVMREPRLLVEAKALGENLDDRRWANQIMGYAAVAGVEWIVLTDGNEYRIYKALESVPAEEKLLRAVRVTDEQAECAEILSLLSKDQLKTNRIDELWTAYFVDRQVKTAITGFFAGSEDVAVVNLILQRTKNLTAEQVRGSLRRCKVKLDFPTSPEEMLAPAAVAKKDRERSPASAPVGGTLREIFDAGILRAPVALHCHYKGRDLVARINADAQVEFQGKRYTSLSLAGAIARATVIGNREDGGPPSTNGWTFWKYTNAAGEEKEIDAARVAYTERSRSSAGASPQTKERAG